jgi:hypothetical protein
VLWARRLVLGGCSHTVTAQLYRPVCAPDYRSFHSLEYLLEQLAEHVRQLQEAIRDLVAWLPR